jgi:hypothetical protein
MIRVSSSSFQHATTLKYTAYIALTSVNNIYIIKVRLHTLISFNDKSVPFELIQTIGFESPTIATDLTQTLRNLAVCGQPSIIKYKYQTRFLLTCRRSKYAIYIDMAWFSLLLVVLELLKM